MKRPMLRLRIGKMRLQLAEFVLLLLCIFLVCGEARPGIFHRADGSRAELIEGLSLLQRKILQDQHTPISTDSRNDEVQETVTQVEQKNWEPTAEEKKEIRETKDDSVAVRQEPQADRDQPKVEENKEAWHQETKAEMAQIEMEEKERALYQERKAEGADATLEGKEREKVAKVEAKTDEKSENQWKSDNGEENPVARKVEEGQETKVGEKKVEIQKQISVDEKKGESKMEERREDAQVDRPIENMKDQPEERKESKVEDRKQISMDEKKEKPKVEETRKDPKVERPHENMKDHPEERKESMAEDRKQISVDEKKEDRKVEETRKDPRVDRPNENMKEQPEERKESMVEDRKQILIDERKEKPKVEETRKDPQVDRPNEDMKDQPGESKESMVEDRKQISATEKKENPKVEERRKDPQVDRPNEGMKNKPEADERKESMVKDRKQVLVDRQAEPIEDMKEVTKVEEKKVDSPNPDDTKQKQVEAEVQTNLGETDERKVEDKKWERQVEEEASKVQDKKEEKAQVGLKSDDKQDKEEKYSTPSKINKGKPIQSGHQEDPHHLDDDYPDFLDELRNFPERFQKTAKSVKDHIRYSGLDRYSTHSKELFNQANQQIEQSFTPLLGKDYAPFLAYFVSYGLLLLPLALVTYLLERIRARYSLQKILLFVNIYLSAYFATLLVVALVLGSEPMSFFMKYSSSNYIFLQLLQGFGFVVYLLLNTAELITTCTNGRIAAKFSSLLQWLVVVAVGFHYYVTVFHRAMARKAPLTGWKIYGLYSIAFIFLCLFARIERGKKHYISMELDDTTDKKN